MGWPLRAASWQCYSGPDIAGKQITMETVPVPVLAGVSNMCRRREAAVVRSSPLSTVFSLFRSAGGEVMPSHCFCHSEANSL